MKQTEAPKEQNVFKATDGKSVVLEGTRKTADGFKNIALKLGISAKGAEGCEDNAISDGHYQFNLITRNRFQLEAAYRGSWIVGRVVNCVAEDMTRAGLDITTNDGAEKLQDFKVQMSRLAVLQSLFETISWARLYGGAIGVLQIEGQDLAKPLDLEKVGKGSFKGIAVYDRWQLNPSMNEIINSGPDIGLPKFYDITLGSNQNDPGLAPMAQAKAEGGSDTGGGRVRVHHSRCVRLIGIKLPYFQAITEMMWGESILERLWDRLIEFDTATAATGGLVTRANLRTIRVDKLRDILAAGGQAEEGLVAMFDYVRKFQSSEGLTLLDKEDEMQSTAYSFAGLADVLIQFGQQVSGAAEIPLVRLFGQSPAGLSATGESDLRNYYDSINAKQESSLRNSMEVILRVLWRSCFNEAAPDDLSFTFTPLWQLSDTDKATVATQNTQSVISAHESGLIKASTALRELKEQSSETGLFKHITDEEIEAAEDEAPPMPEVGAEPEEQKEQSGQLAPHKVVAEAAKKKPTGDSAWQRIKAWLSRDAGFEEGKHKRAENGQFGEGGSGGKSEEKKPAVNEKDKDAAIDALAGVIKDKDWDSFMDHFDEAVGKAKVSEVSPEEASKILRSHNFTFESDPGNEDLHKHNKEKRGKELTDPAIVVEVDGKYFALDGQHRINKAIKSGENVNVAIIKGDFLKKFGVTEKSFAGKKDFSGDEKPRKMSPAQKRIAEYVK